MMENQELISLSFFILWHEPIILSDTTELMDLGYLEIKITYFDLPRVLTDHFRPFNHLFPDFSMCCRE